MLRITILLLLVLAAAPTGAAQTPPTSIATKTAGMLKMDGFLPVYWEAGAGRLWLEIPRLNEELIYVVSLPTGLGSNDVGLDRGQLGAERIVRFERVGPRVLMVQPNYGYRTESSNPEERRAVAESFATSVLWGFTVAAETEGRVLVDATEFALRDAHGVIPALRQSRQGSFRLDPSRSAPFLERTRAFPKNTEIEVTLTFTADSAGEWVRSVAPTGEAVTVRERHSFVELPPPGYEPRANDPRSGYHGIQYRDMSAPLGESQTRRFIARHRLEKRNPEAPVSDPVRPIVYYLDAGVPEPVRSALLEGARWWNQAFEAAGYRDAFRVEMLPPGADPMDVRYNVIQWVHRATRGWSYGSSVLDPRTGEIIKGHVTLGSLRVRQDYLLAEGLLAPYASGSETPPELARMALARIRQLSAHEVGHTLGLAHNYLSSSYGRESVMDYPHPVVRLAQSGQIDLSDAYDVGIGEWDKVAIVFGYQDFPAGTNESTALDGILRAARGRGLLFLTDQDARPAGTLHPQAHLWDNAADAATELERVMRVRRVALERFGERAIRAGEPMATMEEALVPLYLHHRYQVEAAVKTIGGAHYTYALRGDEQLPLRPVPAQDQERALRALLATLSPAALALPRGVIGKLPPRPYTYPAHRELFDRYTGPAFDAIAPAVVASDLVVSLILHPQRAARLVEQHALDPSLPGLERVVDALVQSTFQGTVRDAYEAEIRRATQRVVGEELMRLAFTAPMPQVRAVANLELHELRDRLRAAGAQLPPAERAHRLALAQDISRFLDRPYEPARRLPDLEIPPGAPIGDGF